MLAIGAREGGRAPSPEHPPQATPLSHPESAESLFSIKLLLN